MSRISLSYNTQVLDLLWSINERLSGRPGFDIREPNHDWAFEVIEDIALEAMQNEETSERLNKMR